MVARWQGRGGGEGCAVAEEMAAVRVVAARAAVARMTARKR